MSKLTTAQQNVLNFISGIIEDNGYPPTQAEISKVMGFKSPNAAHDHLKVLEKKMR